MRVNGAAHLRIQRQRRSPSVPVFTSQRPSRVEALRMKTTQGKSGTDSLNGPDGTPYFVLGISALDGPDVLK